MNFSDLYIPLIAGNKNTTYIERSAHTALAPYIRCYWYNEGITEAYDGLVIPDTCVDIIFLVDQRGSINATFCGVNDKPSFDHVAASFEKRKSFAVRFYVWSFTLFSGETLQNSRNIFLDAEIFLRHYVNEIKKVISIDSSFEEFIHISDKLLIKLLKEKYQHPGFMNAVYHVLKHQGNIRIDELAAQCFIGKRHLERLFHDRTDLSPKQFADLVRYQNTWRGILSGQDVNELVLQLGYSDQSHLIRTFKNYHSLTPSEAKLFAYRSNKVD